MDESTARSRHHDALRKAVLWALLPTLVLFLITPSGGDAQVVTNITSSGLNTTVTEAGNVYNITGGTRPGNGPNLFHSFGDFTVGAGDIGNFLNNTGLPTSNILGRVTGGNISSIYGTIQTTDFGNANLFLVNPSGIVLGPTASLNVGGSVAFTTANYLRFEGTTALFDMLSTPESLGPLSVAPVVAFGFLPVELGATRGTISVEGSNLQVQVGQALSLVGGDITVQSGALVDGTVQASSLSAPGGQINLLSVASPGEVLVQSFQTAPNINGASFTTMGTVTIKEGSTLDVSGRLDDSGNPIGNGRSGTILVRGGQLVLDASSLLANTLGAVDGVNPAIDIQVSDLTLTNGALISVATSGSGRAGDVQLTAGTLTMENMALIETVTLGGGGVGGDVVLNVETASLMGGSSILSLNQNFTPGSGQGGNVTIQGLPGAEFGAAQSVTLSDGSSLVSETHGSSDGGQLTITSKSLTMEGAGTTINTSPYDVGHGGDIVVGVQHASLSGGATITTLTISADPNAPAAPTIAVQGLQGAKSNADSVVLSGLGSGIISDTFGQAQAGNVSVRANRISLTDGAVIQAGTPSTSGAGGSVTIVANSVDISGGSGISSQANHSAAGTVTITANTLTMDNVSITTQSVSEGLGGDVVLNVVGSVSLTNGATINSSASGTGRAGNITMNVGTLNLTNGSQISSASIGTEATTNSDGTGTTEPPGTAGNVTITAAGSFTSDASSIATSAEANHGGDISITAQSVQLSNRTVITASSNAPLQVTKLVLDPMTGLLDPNPQVVGEGNAGNITINSGSTFIMQNSSITTEASQASGGQIEITAPEMVHLINSRIVTSVAGSGTDTTGGDITIDPIFVILQNSQFLARAFAGTGGNITIISNVFLADPSSVVSASSQLGISGKVDIRAPVQNISGELAPLSQEFSSAAALLAQRCAARAADGKFSTFVVAGHEGLPAEPGGFLASPSLTAELLGSSLSGRDPHTQFSTVAGSFPEYDARPLQLAKLGSACQR